MGPHKVTISFFVLMHFAYDVIFKFKTVMASRRSKRRKIAKEVQRLMLTDTPGKIRISK